MEDRAKKAFDLATETTKQLLTLATGITTVTVTFSKELATHAPQAKMYVFCAWGAYLVSILCGMLTLMAITGTLEPKGADVPLSIRGRNVVIPAVVQILFFLVGTSFTIWFAIKAL